MIVGGADASCASLLFSAGCGVSLPRSEPIEVSVDEAQVKEILGEVFPNLTDEALSDYAASLDRKPVLALEVELSDIRDVADGLSKGLTELAEQRQTNRVMRNDGYPSRARTTRAPRFL